MKKKPNIIFIITDDQGAWAVESETNHDIKTPNLTRLAAQKYYIGGLTAGGVKG